MHTSLLGSHMITGKAVLCTHHCWEAARLPRKYLWLSCCRQPLSQAAFQHLCQPPQASSRSNQQQPSSQAGHQLRTTTGGGHDALEHSLANTTQHDVAQRAAHAARWMPSTLL